MDPDIVLKDPIGSRQFLKGSDIFPLLILKVLMVPIIQRVLDESFCIVIDQLVLKRTYTDIFI